MEPLLSPRGSARVRAQVCADGWELPPRHPREQGCHRCPRLPRTLSAPPGTPAS